MKRTIITRGPAFVKQYAAILFFSLFSLNNVYSQWTHMTTISSFSSIPPSTNFNVCIPNVNGWVALGGDNGWIINLNSAGTSYLATSPLVAPIKAMAFVNSTNG